MCVKSDLRILPPTYSEREALVSVHPPGAFLHASLTGTHYEHLCHLLLSLNNGVPGSRPIGTYIHLCTTPWSGFNNSPLRSIYCLWFPKLKCFSAPIRIVQIVRSGISLGQIDETAPQKDQTEQSSPRPGYFPNFY